MSDIQVQVQIQEIHDRVRRMETLMFKLAEIAGINKTQDRVVEIMNGGNIRLQGRDVTLTKIKRDLVAAGRFEPKQPLGLWVGECLIGELTLLS